MAFLPASSAAICAANGVDLRDPLKPCDPADDQAIALPWASVIMIFVLLKEALTCATPEIMFLRSRRLTRVFSRAMLLLLSSDSFGRTFSGAGVGMGTLTTDRQATTMAQATVTTKIHQTLNIH